MIKIQQLLVYIVCIVSWASESSVPQYADEILLQHSLPFYSESQCYNSNKQISDIRQQKPDSFTWHSIPCVRVISFLLVLGILFQ